MMICLSPFHPFFPDCSSNGELNISCSHEPSPNKRKSKRNTPSNTEGVFYAFNHCCMFRSVSSVFYCCCWIFFSTPSSSIPISNQSLPHQPFSQANSFHVYRVFLKSRHKLNSNMMVIHQ